MRRAAVVRDGLYFGECPRWRDGRLWYSDFFDGAVHAMTADGSDERVLEVPGEPAGLGWLPDGSLLVVARLDRTVLRWDGAELVQHADLRPYATFHANDMLVDARGRAYVGNFGFDTDEFVRVHGLDALLGDPGPPGTVVCRVDVDGRVSVAADDMAFPNGTALTPDGRTMIIAESMALRLSAFDVDAEGGLSNRRIWADLRMAGCAPDGICLDAEGAVWVANAFAPQCIRVQEGGDILDEVETSQRAYACMLGGDDGRDLYVMTAPTAEPDDALAARQGRIERTSVEVPHAGLP